MKVLALTGGIASGKSTVGQLFAKQGAVVLDADAMAHQVYAPDTPLHQTLIQRYGPKIQKKSGEIDRQVLGKIVFQDEEEKKWLEAQTHPATRALIQQKILEAQKQNPPLIIVEAAIHVETGYYREFAGLIVVHVDPKTQKQRLMERDGLSSAEAEQRLQNQMPVHEKKKYADWVIDNSGVLEKTEQQVQALFEKFVLKKD